MLMIVLGAGVVSAFQVGKAPLALEAIRADLGIDLGAAAWVLSAFAIVGAAFSVFVGVVSDFFDARRTAILGLVLQGLGSALGATALGLPLLLSSRVLEGIGFLAVTVAGPTLNFKAALPRDREKAFAAWATFMPVGMAVVMLAAPAIESVGWRGVWWANAGLLAAYAALFAFAISGRQFDSGDASKGNVTHDLRETIRTAGPLLLAALLCAYTAAFFALFGFLPTILTERLEVAPSAVGILSAIAVGAGALGCLACGRLLSRGVRPSRLLLLGFGMMAASAFGVLAAPIPAWSAYLLCVWFSFIGAFIPVVIFDAAPRHAPRPGLLGMTVGLATQGSSLGIVLGSSVAGAIAASSGWAWVVLWITATATIAVVLVHIFRSQPAEE